MKKRGARDAGGKTRPFNCRQIVRQLMDSNGWSLLPEEDLVVRVQGSAGSEASPGDLRRTAIHHYTLVLYQACRQDQDLSRREHAYSELFRYLFRAAYNRWPDMAEDVTQRALLLVYEQIERCRQPGAFLAFALFKLRHAFDQEQRARRHAGWSGLDDDQVDAVDNEAPDRGKQIRALVDAIRRLPDERQRQTILLKFFGGLSDEEIAARLGVTSGYVRVLRHRGVVQLRQDGQLAGDFAMPDKENEAKGAGDCNVQAPDPS